ncbi:MAG: MerR family transcriptional regulator, partial [Clostridium sp.]
MKYTIGQFSEKVEISTYTLRFYEKVGLLPLVKRNDKGIRIFDKDDIFWIETIKCLRETGMKISDIKHIVDLSLEGDYTKEERKNLLLEHRKKIDLEIKKLKNYINKINKKIEM